MKIRGYRKVIGNSFKLACMDVHNLKVRHGKSHEEAINMACTEFNITNSVLVKHLEEEERKWKEKILNKQPKI